MLKSMIELLLWLRTHNFDASGVTVTVEFDEPDEASRAHRNLLHDCDKDGRALGLTHTKAIYRICGIDLKITSRV